MPSFEIADCPTRVALTESTRDGAQVQSGVLTLTVRNATDRRQTGRLKIEPGPNTKPEWLSFDGAPATGPREIERDFDAKASQTHRVNIQVPVGSSPGTSLFNVRVTAEADPDNDSISSPSVAFDVAKWSAAPPAPTSFPWWAIAVAAAVILIVGGVAGWLLLNGGPRQIDVTGKTQAEATTLLKNAGWAEASLHFKPDDHATGHQPTTVARAVYATDNAAVDLFLDPGVKVPTAANRPLEDVTVDFTKAGLPISQIVQRNQPGVMDGYVINSDPIQGTTVASGTNAKLTVATPAPTICVLRPVYCQIFEGPNSVIGLNGVVNSANLVQSLQNAGTIDRNFNFNAINR